MPNSHGTAEYDHIREENKKVDSIVSHEENQVTTKEAYELENAKAEMGEVRQENQRLKMVLQDIKKDYQSLQLRFFDIVKQDQDTKKSITDIKNDNSACLKRDQKTEESELLFLSLGRNPRSSSESKNVDVQDVGKNTGDQDHDQDDHDHGDLKANLRLGLGSESTGVVTDPSPENSSEIERNDSAAEAHHASNNGDHAAWRSSNKTLGNNGEDHEVSNNEQPPAKRARVSVRARCDAPTMNDGCQWRKYGQKIAKGNPCPRAYYRCTVAPSCPVRKQVQRCAEDMSILITTYEGTHNHPLPVTATAMASTTSAAASMLLSGSSTSSDPTNVGFNTASTTKNAPTMLHGLNFGHFDTMRTKQFYLPNSSTTISSSPLFPTITLDLTASQIPSSSSSSHFTRPSLSSSLARIPSSSLSFGNYSTEPNVLPTLWGNGPYLGYGNTMLPHDKPPIGSLNLGKQSQDILYQRCMEKMSTQANNNNPLHESLTERLTKAITSDPGAFKSVIAAAISSMVGGRGETKQDGMERILDQGLTLGEQNGKGLASSYFNRLSSSNF